MRRPIITAAVAAIAAAAFTQAAPAGEPKSSKVPAATEVGKPIKCVHVRDILDTKPYDDYTIDFVMRGGKRYRNTLDGRCPDLGREKRFGYKITTGNLCSADTITVLVSGSSIRGATCGLSEFVPVRLAG